ncbi:MAG: Uma2 family endonuclease [Candidatus Competibacteraceae bacterium]|nr:Uma2 family endonuclease [Candidatus Competibacteraceae bacterium]MCP5124386.1 Uma2 family endonuclease [Gammaproteobacteria bacterium]HRX69988.1 Uma2 family endonuclease [Candidatus Competibacteraceae bacterium]
MSTALLVHPRPVDLPEPYDGMPVSEADYWEFYYLGHDVTYEWNNGILEEKGVSDYQTFQVYDWFIQLLTEFLHAHPIADRVGLEMGFRLTLSNKTAIRRPDYGVVLHNNSVPLTGPAQSYRGIFDVCIEGVSTSSKAKQERDTVVKKGEYAAGGVVEYYLLHHSPKLRQFYRLNAQGVYEPLPVAPGGIIRSTVLPGFQWRVNDLDRQPSLETLVDDPVYQGYVRLPYQQERQRAEQERQRAERLAARLRALGIDPDVESDQE